MVSSLQPSPSVTQIHKPALLTLAVALLLGPAPARALRRAQESAEARPPLGGWTHTIEELKAPEAVAIGADGRIWVVETGAHRVSIHDAQGQLLERFGRRGSGPGELLAPAGIALFANGRTLVADTGNHRLELFDERHQWQRTIGARGAGPGQFSSPRGLALDGERVWVADSGNDRVQCLSLEGEWLVSITGAEGAHDASGLGPLCAPVALGLLGERLFVADSGQHRVAVFDLEGGERTSFGDWGFFPGLFSQLSGLCAVGGRLYTSDAQNHRVQVFDSSGALLHHFGLHAIVPREGRGKLHYPVSVAVAPDESFCALAEPADDRVQIFGPEGEPDPLDLLRQTAGQPSPHYGQRFMADGAHMVIVEPETHDLLVFDLQWELPRLIGKIGGYGRKVGLFNVPGAVVLDDESLEVWVADDGGRRLQHLRLRIEREGEVKFDATMALFVEQVELERLGRSPGGVELEWPARAEALARDAQGRLFALDARNGCVHVLGQGFEYLRTLGGWSASGGRLLGATDIALSPDGERVYVVDALAGCVQLFDARGAWLASLGRGELESPYGIGVSPRGEVFVTDIGTHELLHLAPDGRLVARVGGPGLGRLEFYKPRGVSFFSEGQVVVLDHGNHRLQWLSPAGEYLGVFGSRLYTRPARLPELGIPRADDGSSGAPPGESGQPESAPLEATPAQTESGGAREGSR